MRGFLVTLLLFAVVPILATPSTLVTIPSTDIQATGVWHLGVDSFIATDYSQGSFVDTGLTYGITPRIEVGVDYFSGQASPVYGNAKVLLLSPGQSPIAVAVGIFNAADSAKSGQNVWYLVGSAKVDALRFTLGGYKGSAGQFGPDDDSGLLAGIELIRGKWWYAADYISGDNALGSWNVGIGYALSDKIGVILGYDTYTLAGVSPTMNIQFDVNF
ncbi:MAG: hypothetical protein ACYC7E_05415 [Armatimonadota bacterium]